MSGVTGPQGPRGLQGPIGPSGITGQNGIQGNRGFPGPPFYPPSMQILQSSNQVNGKLTITRKFETAIPALSSGNSTTIIGLSNDSATGNITLPVGRYYIEAYANLGSNILTASMAINGAGAQGPVSSASLPYGTIQLQGSVIVSDTPQVFSFVETVTTTSGNNENIAPSYIASYFGGGVTGLGPPPIFDPPNISVAIMKLV
jgi:hypothetical protein